VKGRGTQNSGKKESLEAPIAGKQTNLSLQAKDKTNQKPGGNHDSNPTPTNHY